MFEKWKSGLIVLIALALTGCSYIPEPDALTSYMCGDFDTPKLTKINIQTTKLSNGGAPCHVVVKATTFADFLVDDYDKIIPLVEHPDEKVLAVFCVAPGSPKTVSVKGPMDKAIAVYCIFTQPGEGWKRIYELTEEGQTIKILLGQNDIIAVDNL